MTREVNQCREGVGVNRADRWARRAKIERIEGLGVTRERAHRGARWYERGQIDGLGGRIVGLGGSIEGLGGRIEGLGRTRSCAKSSAAASSRAAAREGSARAN